MLAYQSSVGTPFGSNHTYPGESQPEPLEFSTQPFFPTRRYCREVSTSALAMPMAANAVSGGGSELTVRQNPERACVTRAKDLLKDRRPVDPPPIVQLRIRDENDPAHIHLQSPYYFMLCTLHHATEDRSAPVPPSSALAGTLVSSLHRLKDIDNSNGGFFVFGDLSVRVEGEYRLRFSLFEMRNSEVAHVKSVLSRAFTVSSPKSFPGMAESTLLSRSFADQGVKLRLRKKSSTHLKRSLLSQPEECPSLSKRQRYSMDMGPRDFSDANGQYSQQVADPLTGTFYVSRVPPYLCT
jgi:hypothetical protein